MPHLRIDKARRQIIIPVPPHWANPAYHASLHRLLALALDNFDAYAEGEVVEDSPAGQAAPAPLEEAAR